MKNNFAFFILALILTGCQDYLADPRTGKKFASWSSDREFFYYVGNGVSTGSQSSKFSPVIDANWRGGGHMAGQIVKGAIGWKLAGANAALGGLTGLSSSIPQLSPSATPVPVVKAH